MSDFDPDRYSPGNYTRMGRDPEPYMKHDDEGECVLYEDALEAVREAKVITPEIREKLAEVQHTIWSHWMRWMILHTGEIGKDGRWTMDSERQERWIRQMETPYAELTEKEKESDREQADRTIKILQETGDE